MNLLHIKNKGFTLIELMIVIAVIAILTAIALPYYGEYVRQSRTAEATSNLAEMKINIEQYFQDNQTYLGIDNANGPCTPPADAENFNYQCGNITATSFRITANGIGSMAGISYTIDEAGNKTSAYDSTTGATCWITKKTGSC